MADSLIAGMVLEHGAALLTRNRRHFGKVAGLVYYDTQADLDHHRTGFPMWMGQVELQTETD